MILEFPADNTPDFFFVPCDPVTHEELGHRENGTWRVEYDAATTALLFETNKRGRDPETVALYEEAAERARLYAIIEGNGAHSLDDGVERMIARGKLAIMNKQRETALATGVRGSGGEEDGVAHSIQIARARAKLRPMA